MPNLAKCPIHSGCVDAGMFFLKRDGRVSFAQIMKRAHAAHMRHSISWDWIQKQLESVFGPMLAVSRNLFEIDVTSKKDARGFCPEFHPEKFLARARTPTAGWVICNSSLGRLLCKVYERNAEACIDGQVVRLNDVRARMKQPLQLSDQSVA